jgi:hypothetical protein
MLNSHPSACTALTVLASMFACASIRAFTVSVLPSPAAWCKGASSFCNSDISNEFRIDITIEVEKESNFTVALLKHEQKLLMTNIASLTTIYSRLLKPAHKKQVSSLSQKSFANTYILIEAKTKMDQPQLDCKKKSSQVRRVQELKYKFSKRKNMYFDPSRHRVFKIRELTNCVPVEAARSYPIDEVNKQMHKSYIQMNEIQEYHTYIFLKNESSC